MSDEINKEETQPKGEEKTAEVSEDDLEKVSGGPLAEASAARNWKAARKPF